MSGDLAQPGDRSRSIRLGDALARSWEVMADGYGLFPELAVDAVLARARRGELEVAAPRLLELLVGGALPVEDSARIANRLGAHGWSPAGRTVVEEVLDAWWQETLLREPGEHRLPYTPDTVLGVLAGYDAPLIRWLDPWLTALDGPPASHLAMVVLHGLQGPAWDGPDAAAKADAADQVLGWARTETVVNGLALIGGTHLGQEVLGDVLDRLI